MTHIPRPSCTYTTCEMQNLVKVPMLGLFLRLSKSQDITFKECQADAQMKVVNLSVSPYPIVKGSPFTFHLAVESTIPVSDPFFEVRVSHQTLPLMRRHGEFCRPGLECSPVDGLYTYHRKIVLPAFLESGKYIAKFFLSGDENNKKIGCAQADFEIKNGK